MMMRRMRRGMDRRKRMKRRRRRRRMSRRRRMRRSRRRRMRRNNGLNRRYMPIVGVERAIQQVTRNWTKHAKYREKP